MTKSNDLIARIVHYGDGLGPLCGDTEAWQSLEIETLDLDLITCGACRTILHDMDADAEAMVARAEAEAHPIGLTVIEGGGGGSPPTATPPAAA